MKRFKFTLEKVLKLREFAEEECSIALGQAISVLNKIESEIKETALKRHNAAQQRFVRTPEIALWDNYILRLDTEAQKLAEQAAQAEMVVEEKRAAYLEAQKELKVLENLKEKRENEYRKEILAAEMNEVDELTSARHGMV